MGVKDISVFLWPAHRIVHLPRGTTAGHVIRAQVGSLSCVTAGSAPCSLPEVGVRLRAQGAEAAGLASNDDALVNVNNCLVPARTPLADGDYVVCQAERTQHQTAHLTDPAPVPCSFVCVAGQHPHVPAQCLTLPACVRCCDFGTAL